MGVSKGAGVSIVRAGREIDHGWFFMGDKRKENYDDWWRCEVRFEPSLDELFGVTHTKQQVYPCAALLEILTPDLEQAARALNPIAARLARAAPTSSFSCDASSRPPSSRPGAASPACPRCPRRPPETSPPWPTSPSATPCLPGRPPTSRSPTRCCSSRRRGRSCTRSPATRAGAAGTGGAEHGPPAGEPGVQRRFGRQRRRTGQRIASARAGLARRRYPSHGAR